MAGANCLIFFLIAGKPDTYPKQHSGRGAYFYSFFIIGSPVIWFSTTLYPAGRSIPWAGSLEKKKSLPLECK